MKSLLIIVSDFLASWYFTDISSASIFSRVIAPIEGLVFLNSFFIWLVMYFQRKGISQTVSRHGGIGGFSNPGGDGGGEG